MRDYKEIFISIIYLLLVLVISILFALLFLIIALVLILEVLNYLSLKDVQWASWVGGIAAVFAAIYTRRIWINNLIREEIKEITTLHYRYLDRHLKDTFNIHIINTKDKDKDKELENYYNYFKGLEINLDFSDYIGKLESTEMLKYEDIGIYAKQLKETLNKMQTNLNLFFQEMDLYKNAINHKNNKSIHRLDQANYAYESFVKSKIEYERYYFELKKALSKGYRKI